jgi:hypothetical protein
VDFIRNELENARILSQPGTANGEIADSSTAMNR